MNFTLCSLIETMKVTNTHTPVQWPFFQDYPGGPVPETNLDFTEAWDSEWRWHQLGICKSAPRSRQNNHASTSPLTDNSGKEYLFSLTSKFYYFSGQNLETFDIAHLTTNCCKLTNSPKQSGFLAHMYCPLGVLQSLRLSLQLLYSFIPSVLWCCWLGGRKGIRPVKNWVVGCLCGYLSGARCRLAYGPADATATHYLLLQ